MPKPVLATADELNACRGELEAAIAGARATLERSLATSTNALRGELGQVAQALAEHKLVFEQANARVAADAKSYVDVAIAGLREEIFRHLGPMSDNMARANQELEAKMKQVDVSVRSALVDELTSLCGRIEQELAAIRAETSLGLGGKASNGDLAEACQRFDATMVTLRTETETRGQEVTEACQKELHQALAAISQSNEKRDSRSQREQTEIWLRVDRLGETQVECEARVAEAVGQASISAAAELHAFRESAEQRLGQLDAETIKMREAVSEVENVPTRRVDWIIQNVSKRLRPPSPSRKASLHTSWFSPKFNAAGAHGLQLELQLFRPSDHPQTGDLAGDCAVFMWACRGMSMVYKLHVGNKSQLLDKVFNGRVPYGTKRLCFLKDQVNREDDTLRVSVEILESVRELEHIIKPPPVPPPAADGSATCDEEEFAAKTLEGSIIFRRHVNNRLLEQVKGQVDLMRSRMIRRIEWKVDQAALLRPCFPPGEAMCSPSFSAAGIEGMQLIFYPSGYNGASDGYCSFFLFAPAGCTLKCWLSAGGQKREANHSFEESGAFGRTNFCRFETTIDEASDSVLLALEVEEAHQDVLATAAHPTVQAGDRRTQSQIEGASPAAIESVVKLQRVNGRPTPSLEDKRVLPSLWTPKSLGEAGAPDGFHSFDELRGRGGRRADAAAPGGTARRSESTPALKAQDALDRTSLGGCELVPLPQLQRSGGPADFADCGSSRGRRPRQAARRGRGPGGSVAET